MVDVPEATDGQESLAESFWALARRLRRASQSALAQWDLTPSQARALRVLTEHSELRLSGLSERLRIAPRSATEVVDDLESKGLVRRSPDPLDRRATLVAVTERGMHLGRLVAPSRGHEAERMFEHLSAADRLALARILRQLIADSDALEREGSGPLDETPPSAV